MIPYIFSTVKSKLLTIFFSSLNTLKWTLYYFKQQQKQNLHFLKIECTAKKDFFIETLWPLINQERYSIIWGSALCQKQRNLMGLVSSQIMYPWTYFEVLMHVFDQHLGRLCFRLLISWNIIEYSKGKNRGRSPSSSLKIGKCILIFMLCVLIHFLPYANCIICNTGKLPSIMLLST